MTAVIIFILPFAVKAETNNDNYIVTMKQDILCLMMAYSENIKDISADENKNVYIVMNSGRKILYDDKIIKNSEQKFYNPDLQDVMEEIYPLETDKKLMDIDQNPGRCRCYCLLNEVYGSSRNLIEHNLKNTNLIYRKLQFNSQNRASDSLHEVFKEITAIKDRSNVYSSVFPLNGTYNYRLISGTNMLSPHAYGIAIDLNRDRRDYWKWASRNEGQKRLEVYPVEVVNAFQNHNFIWGGKWGHFDTLHFEYRPEIIMKAQYFGTQVKGKNWHEGIKSSDPKIDGFIKKIDSVIK